MLRAPSVDSLFCDSLGHTQGKLEEPLALKFTRYRFIVGVQLVCSLRGIDKWQSRSLWQPICVLEHCSGFLRPYVFAE